tara:strand:+ start:533 stop:1645 length:1113 start_codon:yes stop_codon:yes gene_type:complete
MAKFLNKKEQVYDLKLTNYGHYLLSIGKLKPVYYSFMDDNIIYDGKYAGIDEKQNDILFRIKEESQYIEGLTNFQDAENQFSTLGSLYSEEAKTQAQDAGTYVDPVFFDVDINPQRIEPRVDNYVYSAIIGDAYLEGETQVAPAWKLVSLEGAITSQQTEDSVNNIRIPQINIEALYSKEIQDYDPGIIVEEQNIREFITTSPPFNDNKVIKLMREDLMVYGEEVNTALLTENFDIEVFEVVKNAYPANSTTDATRRDVFKRKYFPTEKSNIRGGKMMVTRGSDGSQKAIKYTSDIQTPKNDIVIKESVAYYFDFLLDGQISQEQACKAASQFNRNSYYVDLDFECENIKEANPLHVDIYGKVTEPEICL